MKLSVFLVLLVSLFRCGGDSDSQKLVACAECTTTAVVKDLTGLDGCGFVFELADGTRLEPARRVYSQAPKPEDDPLYYFELKEGDTVRISYEETKALTTCMAGKFVYITCIKSCNQNSVEQ